VILLNPCYNIHFFDREYILVHTTQTEMLNFNRNEIIGFPLLEYLPPCEAIPTMRAIDKAFTSYEPVYHSYSYRDLSFLLLIDRVDDSAVAVHEVFDNPHDRPRLKKLLWIASGNLKKRLNNKLKTI